MSTTVSARTCENTPNPLFDAPLPELLAAVGAEVTDAPVEYDNFEGVAVKPASGGPIQIMLPKARTAEHRDAMLRLLVGRLLGADVKTPASLQARTFGGVR